MPYGWLLALHVLAAFAVVSAVVLYTVLIVVGRALTVPSDVVRVFRVSRMADVLMGAGMVGVLVFGVWLALDTDPYAISDGWIIAALVLWLVGGALGDQVGKVYYRARDRAQVLVDEGRDEPSAELGVLLRSQRGLLLHGLSALVVLLLLIDMIFKPGA